MKNTTKPGAQPTVISQWQKVLDEMVSTGISHGVAHLTAEDTQIDGRIVTLNGHQLINFGSCSYTGLEIDPRLKEGVIDAVKRFGTQFASSRAYVSAPAYQEFEALVDKIFEGPNVITQTTTLGHFAALPVLIQRGDAVLYDVQVHASVQAVFPTLRNSGISSTIVDHNNMDQLEQLVTDLAPKHKKIWYLCDGLYSMHGDFAPLERLQSMAKQHEQLYLYIDDAHSISWLGRRGAGSVLGVENPIRTKTVVAVTFAKAFSASGAAIVFPDPESRRLVRNCGSTMHFSGPLHPPMLGACIASAHIHLSDEIYQIQREVVERIELFNSLCKQWNLPLCSTAVTPIRFIEIGPEKETFNIVKKLMSAGFYVNFSTYPAVPRHRSGLRIPLTRHLTLDDIRNLLATLAELVSVSRI